MTSMELEFYNAALQGNIDAFEGKGSEEIESILTPNENTILHVHFTNYHDRVSETFVKQVLAMCPSLVLKKNVKYETVLHIAARYGHHRMVQILINCAKSLPEDINEVAAEKRLIRAMNVKKDTALHEAARYNHNEVVDILIKEESDHSYFGQNVYGETPLYIAVERQHWNVVDMMLNNGDSPQYSGPYRRTALHAAAFHLDEEKVSKLLTSDLTATKEADKNGLVPLHLATIVGNSKVVELLLRNDRSTAYMQDVNGRTALHFAACRKDSSVMKKIIEYCPDCCELVDKNGFNALHYTIMGDSYYPLSELTQIVQDVPQISNLCNETDIDGNTPLHLLAHYASKNDDLLDHPLLKSQYPRVDTMAYNKYGETVLDIAVADDKLSHLADENKLLIKFKGIGARLGGRVLHKFLEIAKPAKMLNYPSPFLFTTGKNDYDSYCPRITMNGEGKGKQSKFHKLQNKLLVKLKDIGARLGGRFLQKHLGETKTTTMKGERKKKQSNSFDGYDTKTKIDYLVGISNTLSIVAILIATVTFTAGFTLPGGLIQEGEHQGSPILNYNAAFMTFVITDALSFVTSTSTVLAIFLASIVPKENYESRQVYRSLLSKCVYSTLVALGFMVVAFGAGMYSVLGVSKGFGVLTLLIIFSFFIIFIILLPRAYKFMGSLRISGAKTCL